MSCASDGECTKIKKNVYSKTYIKGILPGAIPCSRAKGFQEISGKHRCLCDSLSKNASMNGSKDQEETVDNSSSDRQPF